MGRSTRNINKSDSGEIHRDHCVIVENLPFPFVHYPSWIGAFIGFAQDDSSSVYMCTCSERAVRNYFSLVNLEEKDDCFEENHRLDVTKKFPSQIAEQIIADPNFHVDMLKFQPELCHKCNMSSPYIRACGPPENNFKQYYMWYITQQYYMLGITPFNLLPFLITECPSELSSILQELPALNDQINIERERLVEIANGPVRHDIPVDQIYWANVTKEEANEYDSLEKKGRKLLRKLNNDIENLVRVEFGIRKIGEGWISESILFNIVQKLFPNDEVIRHHRPQWLEGLELDVYVPEKKIGFEYQGQQHYKPVEAWGGEEALVKVQERDKRKKELCEDLQVKLIEVKYTEPLTEDHIISKL